MIEAVEDRIGILEQAVHRESHLFDRCDAGAQLSRVGIRTARRRGLTAPHPASTTATPRLSGTSSDLRLFVQSVATRHCPASRRRQRLGVAAGEEATQSVTVRAARGRRRRASARDRRRGRSGRSRRARNDGEPLAFDTLPIRLTGALVARIGIERHAVVGDLPTSGHLDRAETGDARTADG